MMRTKADTDSVTHGWLIGQLLDERHSLLLSIALHLIPGVLIFAAYALLGLPVAEALGYPPVVGYLLVTPFVFVPAELGLLFYLGGRRNARWSLEGVVFYLGKPLRSVTLTVLVGVLVLWTFTSSIILAPLDAILYEQFASWMPMRFFLGGGASNPFAGYARSTIIATLCLWFTLGGVILPIIEEFYFRGYLLPRLAYLGRWAPVLNMVLFAIYHLWSPWQIVSRIAFFLPTVWVTWRKKDLRISIWVHCLGNSIGILLSLTLILAGSMP